MAISLYPHNEEAYGSLLSMLPETGKACVIHPTGTGKSFIGFKYCEEHPEKKIIMMGDSAGGGLSLALTEYFKAEGIRVPDELILFSPWVDVSMGNEEIKDFISRDPMIGPEEVLPAARSWAGDRDMHDPLISPLFGDLKGLHNVTVFIGTEEVLYPDVTKMFHMLDADVSNELIVGEGMIHCYPLNPVEEAIHACHKVFHIVMR